MPERKISRLESNISELKQKHAKFPPIYIAHLCFGIALFFGLLTKLGGNTNFGTASTVLAFLFGAPALWLYSQYSKIDQELRDTVVPEAIGLVRPGLKYFPHSSFRTDELKNTLFFPWEIGTSRTFNEIRGSFKGIAYRTFQFEARSYKRTNDSHKTLFGLMIEIAHGRNVKGITKVEPDELLNKMENKIGELFEEPFYKTQGLEPVRLENPEFEELFAATSTDQIEARTLLTPKMMEQLVGAHKQLDKRLSCVFLEKSLFICIPGYEVKLHVSPETSLDSIRQELEIAISRVESLILTLELNENLGLTKKKKKLVRLG